LANARVIPEGRGRLVLAKKIDVGPRKAFKQRLYHAGGEQHVAQATTGVDDQQIRLRR